MKKKEKEKQEPDKTKFKKCGTGTKQILTPEYDVWRVERLIYLWFI